MKYILWLLIALAIIVAQIPSRQIIYKAEARELSVEEKITILSKKYKVDANLAKKIIYCESSGKQSARGLQASVGIDYGLWQINSHFHAKAAYNSNLSLLDEDDNLEYGFMLFAKEGVRPWKASKKCWSATTKSLN